MQRWDCRNVPSDVRVLLAHEIDNLKLTFIFELWRNQRRRKQFQTGVAKNSNLSMIPGDQGRTVFFVLEKLKVSLDGGGGNANENFGKLMSVPPKTGVAKPYPCHTTFQTGVATATPATPLPAPLDAMVEDMVLYSELSLLLIAVIRTIHGINLLRSKCICFYGNIFFIKKSVHKGMYQSPRKGQNRSATDLIQHILCTSTPTEINATPSVYEWFSSDPIIFKQFIKVFQWFSKIIQWLKSANRRSVFRCFTYLPHCSDSFYQVSKCYRVFSSKLIQI